MNDVGTPSKSSSYRFYNRPRQAPSRQQFAVAVCVLCFVGALVLFAASGRATPLLISTLDFVRSLGPLGVPVLILCECVAFLALLPFALYHEAEPFSAALVREPRVSLGFLLGSSLLAVSYNVTVFQSSKSLSAVGTALLANVKIVILFVLSALILGEMGAWRAREWIGCALSLGGTALYSRLKWLKQQQK